LAKRDEHRIFFNQLQHKSFFKIASVKGIIRSINKNLSQIEREIDSLVHQSSHLHIVIFLSATGFANRQKKKIICFFFLLE
jgi:hypothetical protein